MARLEGRLVTREDWYTFAYVIPEGGDINKPYDDGATELGEWLGQFSDGASITVTVEEGS
jgi:hypothetical protein